MDEIKKNKQTFSKLVKIALAISPLAIISAFFTNGISIVFYAIGWIIALAAYYYVKISLPFKNNVIPEVLKNHKSNIEFIPVLKDFNDYKEMIRKYKLIPSATTFRFTDGIVDEVKGYKTTSFDLHATHTQSTGKSTTTITDFKGRFYDIEFQKLPCDFVIKEEYFKNMPKGYEFVELEHIEFNKVFNIYVTDKLEAFKVFTPSTIKKYYELAGVDNFKTIINYNNNHLYVFLYHSANIFEYTNEDYEKKIIEDYLKQYNDIIPYIEAFELDAIHYEK